MCLRIFSKVGFLNRKIQRKKSEKIQNEKDLLRTKFEGTLLGALIGDCVGKSLEGIWGPDMNELLEELRIINEKSLDENEIENLKHYSDDLALTKSICESLINREEFDIEDLVNNFLALYYQDPTRGFSSASLTLFKKLSQLKIKNELQTKFLIPAMELFDGEGSHGSGAAIRCLPIALFTFLKSIDEMKLTCELSTRITHTHKWAILGAMQQCFSIRLALQHNKFNMEIDLDTYYYYILNFVYEIEINFENLDQIKLENLNKYPLNMKKNLISYLDQKKTWSQENKINQNKILNNLSCTYLLLKFLKLIKRCRRGQKINMPQLQKLISSYQSSAIVSISLALLSFMIANDSKCSNEVNFKLNSKSAFKQYNSIERTIFYAVSFGGEIQKIASMASAIAGAYYSSDQIPKYLIEICESSEPIKNYANQLFDLCFKDDFLINEPNSKIFCNKVNLDLVNTDDEFF